MFHRRLLLILATFAAMIVVMTGQMIRLSVVQGSERLAEAESKLDVRTFLPTHRGRILDRHGRVLALDRASSNIAVEYAVITGVWCKTQARKQAVASVGRAKWNALSLEQREAEVHKFIPETQAKRTRLWQEICRLGNMTQDQLQSRMDEIKADVQSTAAMVWERQRLQEQMEFGITEEEFKPQPIREQKEAHVILAGVSDDVAFAFRKLDQQFPDMVVVQDSRRREYPWSSAEVRLSRTSLPRPLRNEQPLMVRVIGVADHVIGSVRDEVWGEDVQRRPFRDPVSGAIDLGWYKPGDVVGARGIEGAFEDVLRGLRGEVHERVDTGEQTRTEPVPGRDVRLTLDIALQARVQAILSHQFGLSRVQSWQNNLRMPLGQPLNAAAVVIEIQTGEILSIVSMPTIAMGETMTNLEKQVNYPLVNRAAEAVYPPGSIIKPLVLAAAVSEGVHSLGSPIVCNGHYFEDKKDAARCWIYREQYGMRTHGPLLAEEALARSCNIFFYTLGDRLGMERLADWFARFGMGQRLNIASPSGLATARGSPPALSESPGEVPDAADIAKFKSAGDLRFRQVTMGIGQGPVTWTPVQAANAYATLARGGVIRDATLVMDDSLVDRSKRRADLGLKPSLVNAALEGLRGSVMERYGTGYHITYEDQTDDPIINAQGVQVWAKTGTAQAPPWRVQDTNSDGVINSKDDGIEKLDHSWFVGLVGPRDSNKPMHAIAVIVEYGGSGGRTAGPIANQIIRALQAEGYLPGNADAGLASSRGAQSVNEPQPDSEDDH